MAQGVLLTSWRTLHHTNNSLAKLRTCIDNGAQCSSSKSANWWIGMWAGLDESKES